MEKSIWHDPMSVDALNRLGADTLDQHLGIRITELGDSYVRGTMPVDNRTRQPYGILHGGASVVLAESLGSVASNLCVDRTRFQCVGIEINANHVRAVRSGQVTGTVRPVHVGRKTHVWQIKLRDDDGQLTCISRLTVAILERKSHRPIGRPA